MPEGTQRPRPAAPPLAGIRVLDLTRVISGPYCTRLLADCGAEVIKVEPPGGEHMRGKQPMRDGRSRYFGHVNAGKKSVVADLRDPADRAAVCRLAVDCDVLVENFRPGVMAELGLDYPSLAGVHPGLVYCSISGFGQDGPRSRQPAYAPVVHAVSGHDRTAQDNQPGAEAPRSSGVHYADLTAGIYAFGAIQTALLARERGGGGRFIDVSLMDAMLNLMVLEVQEAQCAELPPRRDFPPVRAADGHVIVTPVSARNFESLARAIGREDWLTDARFAGPALRERNWSALMAETEAWTLQRPAAECEERLMAAGVPCARYRTVAEAMADPQTVARGSMARVSDGAGDFQVPEPPFRFQGGGVGVSARVPDLGEHNHLLDSAVPATAG